MTDTRITKRCKLYINEIYKSGDIGGFTDLLLERIGHASLSDIEYKVVGHTCGRVIEFEVSGHYEDEEAEALDAR
jgi:hypothetical protein